ncbi:MAG: MCE family protein [Desulfovibrionaceae bacterium]|nr:MCE family protein [Desulfovibrionaceae bacterium]
MEIRANYVMVGLFALIIIIVAAGYAVWAGKSSNREATMIYGIEFSGEVSGLQVGSPVSFNGIRVGSVKKVRISPRDSSKVDVLIEVQATLPVRADSEASLEIRGITGQAGISISSGDHNGPLLTEVSDQVPPMIRSRNSNLQEVMEIFPVILAEAKVTFKQLNSFLSDENKNNFDKLLVNLSEVSDTAKGTMKKLDKLADELDTAVVNVNQAMADLQATAHTLNETVSKSGPGITRFSTEGLDELRSLLSDTRHLVNNLDRITRKVENEPRQFLFGSQLREYEGK